MRLERLLDLDARTPEILTRRVLEICEIEFLTRTDAGRLGGEYDGVFDIHLSHCALERVPPDDVHRVLETAARLLKPGGVSARKIDHTDHVAHDDPSLDLMDFLRFDDSEWANRTSKKRLCIREQAPGVRVSAHIRRFLVGNPHRDELRGRGERPVDRIRRSAARRKV